MSGTRIKRTNVVALLTRENNNNKPEQQQRQRQHQSRRLQQLSSFRCLVIVCIVIGVNISILSTLLYSDNNDATRKGGVHKGQRILSSHNYAYNYFPSEKYEDNPSKGGGKISTSSSTSTSMSFSSTSTKDQISISDSTHGKLLQSPKNITSSLSAVLPYYLKGKTNYQSQEYHRRKTFQFIQDEAAKPIQNSQRVWVLKDPIKSPTRNHESVLLEYATSNDDNDDNEKQILVNVLGRYSRGVQWMDLKTGEQNIVDTNGTDPDHRPLNDLNHVASVVVDSIDVDENNNTNRRKKKEIWLPCGFHNDRIGKELSSNYVRVIDLETMQVRVGPKLPFSGGACGAAPIQAISGEPPLICSFGGTDGNHDKGIFLPYVSCYDRLSKKWVYPFGKLPVGMDHLSVVVVPKNACHPQDPSRVLVFNFRTKNYSTHTSAEILAFDIPEDGWTRKFLESTTADKKGDWYTFVNHTFNGADDAYAPRDASGVVMANGGKSVVNFGGINQVRNPISTKKDKRNRPKVFSTWYSTVRELNVCSKTWKKVADLGIQTFALMASASTKLNAAFFCGGAMYRQDFNGNTQLCLAIRIPGIKFWNHRTAAVENFPPEFQVGGKAKKIGTSVKLS